MNNTDDRDLFSNGDNTDDKDLFSYDNSNNIVEDGTTSFDLNSFSSKTASTTEEKNKKQKKCKKPEALSLRFFVR